MRTELLLPVVWDSAELNDKYTLIAETHECAEVCGSDNDPDFGIEVFFTVYADDERVAERFPACKLWFFRRPFGKGTIVDFDIDWDVGCYSQYTDEGHGVLSPIELGGNDFYYALGILETSLAKNLARQLAKKLDSYFNDVIKEAAA